MYSINTQNKRTITTNPKNVNPIKKRTDVIRVLMIKTSGKNICLLCKDKGNQIDHRCRYGVDPFFLDRK